MFEDVPQELNDWILNSPDARRPVALPLVAAFSVCQLYLGTIFENSNSPLLNRAPLKPDEVHLLYAARIIQIAGAVFALRNEPGFPEICRRLATRPLLAAFFEAKGAQLFQEIGFSISARPETSTKGSDFDFSIAVDGAEANVEATAFTGEQFSRNSVRNTLRQKRKQLPDDKPGIIVCFVPRRWRPSVWDIQWELKTLGEQFLRGTRRINHLYFNEEMMFRTHQGALATGMHCLHYTNMTPRISAPILDEILAARLAADEPGRAMMRDGIDKAYVGTGPFPQ